MSLTHALTSDEASALLGGFGLGAGDGLGVGVGDGVGLGVEVGVGVGGGKGGRFEPSPPPKSGPPESESDVEQTEELSARLIEHADGSAESEHAFTASQCCFMYALQAFEKPGPVGGVQSTTFGLRGSPSARTKSGTATEQIMNARRNFTCLLWMRLRCRRRTIGTSPNMI